MKVFGENYQMNGGKLSFWKRWLLHSFLVWFIGNLLNFCNFLYKKSQWGDYLVYENGKTVTTFEYFKNVFNLDGTFSILLCILIIELNSYYFFRKKTWMFLLSSLVTGSVIIFYVVTDRNEPFMPYLIYIFVIAPYAFAYPFVMDFIDTKFFKAERSLQQATAELHTLKAQINPHFFFNTLNGVYGTALKEEARDTAVAIEKLSGMMRYVLTEGSGNFVPVESELKFVSEYIELQKMRIPQNDHIQLKTTIDYDEQHALIAPLLLLPLIENAFQYAISMEKESFIVLNILVHNKQLKMYIRNSVNSQANKGTGIGIANVKRRLQLLYPGRHELNVTATPDVYTVQLEIKL